MIRTNMLKDYVLKWFDLLKVANRIPFLKFYGMTFRLLVELLNGKLWNINYEYSISYTKVNQLVY